MKKYNYFEVVLIIFLSLILFVLIIKYFFSPLKVSGESMEPLLFDGDIVFVSKVIPKEGIKRGDVVVLRDNSGNLAIKRVIAKEGDKIEFKNGEIFVNGENRGKISYEGIKLVEDANFVVEKGRIFVLGENRIKSVDSRIWGTIPISSVLGKVIFLKTSFFRKKGK